MLLPVVVASSTTPSFYGKLPDSGTKKGRSSMVSAHRPQRDVDELPLVPADRDSAEIVRDVSATLDMTNQGG